MRRGLSAWLLPGLLGGCGLAADPELVNGGGGIEIPNGLKVLVRDGQGRPVPGAVVRRVASGTWGQRVGAGRSPVLDSATTDAGGMAVLRRDSLDAWVEAFAQGKAGRLRVEDTGTLAVAELAVPQGLTGRWPDSVALPDRILLAGSSRTCVPTSERGFRFDSLPGGTYELVSLRGSTLRLAGSATPGDPAGPLLDLAGDSSGMRIEDFEDGDLRFKYANLFGEGYWWRQAKVPVADLPTVFGNADMASSVVRDGNGSHLSVRVDGSAMGSSPWANFGLDLGRGAVGARLGALKAVRLRVRGKGSWSLDLSVAGPGGKELWRADSLAVGADWSTLRVPASAFRQVEGVSSGSWDAVPRWILAPHFQIWGSGEIDVDDLFLEGVGLGDWERIE